MAGRSQRTEWILFRSIVVPVFFVTMIFRKTALQWLALGVLAAWLLLSVFLFFKRRTKRQSKKAAVRELREHNDALPEEPTEQAELNLIRQVNYRITELLKQSYPAVAWLWDKRPTAEEIGRGGAWRILMEHANPFNYAEITIEINGAMHISLMQVVPLEARELSEQEGDDVQERILDRESVTKWFASYGEQYLCELADELNTQGHKQMRITEDGSVIVTNAGEDKVVDTIHHFPPRAAWRELCSLVRDADLCAEICEDTLSLQWA